MCIIIAFISILVETNRFTYRKEVSAKAFKDEIRNHPYDIILTLNSRHWHAYLQVVNKPAVRNREILKIVVISFVARALFFIWPERFFKPDLQRRFLAVLMTTIIVRRVGQSFRRYVRYPRTRAVQYTTIRKNDRGGGGAGKTVFFSLDAICYDLLAYTAAAAATAWRLSIYARVHEK